MEQPADVIKYKEETLRKFVGSTYYNGTPLSERG
jgi:hypothetical protein